MGSEFEYKPLKFFIAEKPRNGLYKGKEYQGSGNRWIKMNEVFSLDFISNNETSEKLEVSDSEIERFSCKSGDLLFGRTSLTLEGVGDCLLVQEIKDSPIFESNLFRIRFDLTKAFPLFFYYFFKSHFGRQIIQRIAKQTAATSITATDLIEEDVPYFSLNEQVKIANLIYQFDKKSNLNCHSNQTLGQIAQALFKSWFVDFDPVIDNALAAGNTLPAELHHRKAVRQRADALQASNPKIAPLPQATQALFPNEFEHCGDNTLGIQGWIPKGWKVNPVSNALKVNPRVKLTKGEKAKFADMKALPTTGYTISDIIEKEYKGGAKFQQHDVLLARITPCLENGKTALVDFLEDEEVGFGSTEFIVLRGGRGIPYSFVACLARLESFRLHCIQNMVGSSGRQRVQNSCFESYYIVTPEFETILREFDKYTQPMFRKMKLNCEQGKKLASARDTLLPKLISGELILRKDKIYE